MTTAKTYASGDLKLEVRSGESAIEVAWLGRSTARDPSSFLGPILTDALRQAGAAGQGVVLDFRRLEYMNSSTITPVIRLLHEAKRGTARVKILFKQTSRWQELSFSALTIFQTDDERIQIRGV